MEYMKKAEWALAKAHRALFSSSIITFSLILWVIVAHGASDAPLPSCFSLEICIAEQDFELNCRQISDMMALFSSAVLFLEHGSGGGGAWERGRLTSFWGRL